MLMIFGEIWVYLATGALAGISAGLFGVGGGLIIVPVLVAGFIGTGVSADVVVHMAVGTSLATIVFTSLSSSWAHHRRGAVLWPVFVRYAPGLLLGAWLGAMTADHLASPTLGRVFGVFELGVGIWMWLDRPPHPHRGLPGKAGLALIGVCVGWVSALVGIGGGTLTVPFLVWCNQVPRAAVATAAVSGLPIALAGAIGFMVAGWDVATLPQGSLGYVYLPALASIAVVSVLFAPLGARIAHTLPAALLKRGFALLLLGLATTMLW
jgi:uncharacterized membrane protein YfcA